MVSFLNAYLWYDMGGNYSERLKMENVYDNTLL
jgi:hypothetical protein